MKKIIGIILVVCFFTAMLAGCATPVSKDPVDPTPDVETPDVGAEDQEPELKPYKMAVAFFQLDANAMQMQKYLSEYVGPAFNVEFMFSEAVADVETLMTFMESAYAAGCEAIINFQGGAMDQAIAKANELGIYIVSNTTTMAENVDLPYNLGNIAANVEQCAKDFGMLCEDLLDDGEDHSVVIVSAGAGMGNNEHRESTVAILNTLQDIYGLTYEQEIIDIATTRAQLDATNDKGIKITIYPGFPSAPNYVDGISTILQSGEYDTVLSCNAGYAQFSNAIADVENATGKNIRVAAITAVTEQTKTFFNTEDSTGDTALNSAVLMPNVSTIAGLFILAYNGVSGNADLVRPGNTGILYDCNKWPCKDAAQYARIDKLNTSDDTYEVSVDQIKDMLYIYNSDLTSDSIKGFLAGLTVDSVLASRGL